MAERRTKTPAEKAEEPIGVVTRKIDKIRAAIKHQRELVSDYEQQLAEQQRRLIYLADNPDLEQVVIDELQGSGYLPSTGVQA